MSSGHDSEDPHGHAHAHGRSNRSADWRALIIAFVITFGFMLVEAVGGWLSNSLALLADAGHMFTDVGALGLSLFANWLTHHPARRRRTFGLQRAEILAAFLNGLAMLGICTWIFYEAYGRFRDPPAVLSGWMLLVACLGLLANALTFSVLWRSGGESLNLRGALLHVFGDALGSVGAIAAALLVMLTGWRQADVLISVVIAMLVILSAWQLLAETIRVLLEIAPSHITPEAVRAMLTTLPGVAEVHDVHVWTITSGVEAASGHVRLTDDRVDAQRLETVLKEADLILQKFGLAHVTLQVEPFHHTHPQCRF